MEARYGHDRLHDAVGRRLIGIARAHFRHQGQVDDERGALELTFDGGPVLHLTTAPNGQSVAVREGPWRDPVIDPEEPPSAEWIAEHGEWIRVDASELPGFAGAIGQALEAVRPLAGSSRSLAGVELHFGPAVLTFASWGDEEYVFIGDGSAIPAVWGIGWTRDADSTEAR